MYVCQCCGVCVHDCTPVRCVAVAAVWVSKLIDVPYMLIAAFVFCCCAGRTVLDPAAAGGNKNAKAMFGKDELAAILR